MSNIKLFPVSRSRGRIRAIADAIDAPAAEADAAWRRECLALARALLDQGVPDDRVDTELELLLFAAQDAVARRRAARKAARERKDQRRTIELVRSGQLDLFEQPPLAPTALPVRLHGEAGDVA